MKRKLEITYSYDKNEKGLTECLISALEAHALTTIAEEMVSRPELREGELTYYDLDSDNEAEYHGKWEMVIDKPAQTPKYMLKEDGIHVFGNGFVELNEKIRDEEEHEYYITGRKDFIEQLIQWISECTTSNKELMMEDLKMLMSWSDDYIFTSNSTNSYIGSHSEEFNSTCEELIELNKQY